MLPSFDTEQILAATGGRALGRGPRGPITANCQTMAAGEWFVALAGDGFDDHGMVPEAARRGVAGVIVEHAPREPVPAIVVPDTWAALRALATAARRAFSGPVVGITGSVGKTTTRALTALALSPLGTVHQTQANQNGEPGVPLTLLEAPTHAAAQVLELGTCRPGEIRRHAQTVLPDVRIVTAIDAAHLDRLGDLDGVAREKGALVATARPGDVVIVPLSCPRCAALPHPAHVRRVTVGPGGDVELEACEVDGASLVGTWRTPEGVLRGRIPSPAPFVASNACFALASAWVLGVDLPEAVAALEPYRPVGSRLHPVAVGGATVYDDSFNASPASVKAAVTWLGTQGPGRRVLVLGAMRALGSHSERLHHEVVTVVRQAQLDAVLFLGEPLVGMASGVAATAEDVDEAAAWLHAQLGDGDVALVKGARSLGLERVVRHAAG